MISELNSHLQATRLSTFADLICKKFEPKDFPKLIETIDSIQRSSLMIQPDHYFKIPASVEEIQNFERIAWYMLHTHRVDFFSINSLRWRIRNATVTYTGNPFPSNHCFRLLSSPRADKKSG